MVNTSALFGANGHGPSSPVPVRGGAAPSFSSSSSSSSSSNTVFTSASISSNVSTATAISPLGARGRRKRPHWGKSKEEQDNGGGFKDGRKGDGAAAEKRQRSTSASHTGLGFWAHFLPVESVDEVWRGLVNGLLFGKRFGEILRIMTCQSSSSSSKNSSGGRRGMPTPGATFDSLMGDTQEPNFYGQRIRRNCCAVVPCALDEDEMRRVGASFLAIRRPDDPLYFREWTVGTAGNTNGGRYRGLIATESHHSRRFRLLMASPNPVSAAGSGGGLGGAAGGTSSSEDKAASKAASTRPRTMATTLDEHIHASSYKIVATLQQHTDHAPPVVDGGTRAGDTMAVAGCGSLLSDSLDARRAPAVKSKNRVSPQVPRYKVRLFALDGVQWIES